MKYSIKIPKPCNEKWNEMTPTEKGAFCSKCNKEVFDFTYKTNFELSRLIDNKQNLCGKFKPEQLNVDIKSLKDNRKFHIVILIGFSTILTSFSPLFSQNKVNQKNDIVKIDKENDNNFDEIKSKDSIVIKGQVLDSNEKHPLPGANIILKGHPYGVQTDFDGNFSIEISMKDLNNNTALEVSFIGYEKQERKIYPKTEFLKFEMIEDEDNALMGEVVIIKKQNVFRRFGNLFKRKN
jgi:hypothetical protein